MKLCYERRFFIAPEVALRLRDFVTEYMDFDEFCVGQPDHNYSVHTIYLDSDGWRIYWRAAQGEQDRWKLRLRYYDEEPQSPVFCEVKHQTSDVITKQRGGVRREAVNSVLDGHVPHPEQLTEKNPKCLMAIERFVTLMLEWNARPRLHIFFQREAYVSCDEKTRITLDRRICVSELSGNLLATQMDKPLIGEDRAVLLMLRFAERFPNWCRDMVRAFNLGEAFHSKHVHQTIFCAGLRLTLADLIYNIVL